jgi:predicted acyl esterase
MPVRLEVRTGDGEYYVREESAWPIEDTEYRKLYLDGYNNSLADEPLPIKTLTEYASVNVNDEVTFRHTFAEDTEIAGYSRLKLWVSTSHGSDMDIFVAIRKIDEDGNVKQFMNALRMRDVATRGWLRVSLRKLDEELASDIQPVLALDEYQPIQPDEIVPVEIEILPFAVLFEEGTTLELVVKGSDIAQEATVQHDKLVNQGFHRIYAGQDRDSYLMLPVIEPR